MTGHKPTSGWICDDCGQQWGRRNAVHCPLCHQIFSSRSIALFHRYDGRCLDASKMPLAAYNRNGTAFIWGKDMSKFKLKDNSKQAEPRASVPSPRPEQPPA